VLPRRGGERHFTERGNFAADSLHMKNHRLRMKPQVWARSAEAEASARRALMRAPAGDPAALRLCLERILAPRRERPVQLDLPPIRAAADNTGVVTAITTAVVPHRALLVRQGAVIGEGENSATARHALPLAGRSRRRISAAIVAPTSPCIVHLSGRGGE